MSEINDGGPAFPGGDPPDEALVFSYPGMSLRDWFAGQALVGLLAMHSDPDCVAPEASLTADHVYKYADAMLAERQKGGAA